MITALLLRLLSSSSPFFCTCSFSIFGDFDFSAGDNVGHGASPNAAGRSPHPPYIPSALRPRPGESNGAPLSITIQLLTLCRSTFASSIPTGLTSVSLLHQALAFAFTILSQGKTDSRSRTSLAGGRTGSRPYSTVNRLRFVSSLSNLLNRALSRILCLGLIASSGNFELEAFSGHFPFPYPAASVPRTILAVSLRTLYCPFYIPALCLKLYRIYLAVMFSRELLSENADESSGITVVRTIPAHNTSLHWRHTNRTVHTFHLEPLHTRNLGFTSLMGFSLSPSMLQSMLETLSHKWYGPCYMGFTNSTSNALGQIKLRIVKSVHFTLTPQKLNSEACINFLAKCQRSTSILLVPPCELVAQPSFNGRTHFSTQPPATTSSVCMVVRRNHFVNFGRTKFHITVVCSCLLITGLLMPQKSIVCLFSESLGLLNLTWLSLVWGLVSPKSSPLA